MSSDWSRTHFRLQRAVPLLMMSCLQSMSNNKKRRIPAFATRYKALFSRLVGLDIANPDNVLRAGLNHMEHKTEIPGNAASPLMPYMPPGTLSPLESGQRLTGSYGEHQLSGRLHYTVERKTGGAGYDRGNPERNLRCRCSGVTRSLLS